MIASNHAFLSSRETFEAFVFAWESGTLPKSEWTHAAHVAIGSSYAVRFGDDAFARTRAGIIRYNESVGTINGDDSGYHETLTRFWSIILTNFVASYSDPYDAAHDAVAEFGHQRSFHTDFYSFDVVRDTAARKSWVPPDLCELPNS